MSTHVFNDIINNDGKSNTYFSRFEKLFFKKLKKEWDDLNDPDSQNHGNHITEKLVECFNEAKQEVIELKKRRSYALEN